MMSRSHCRQTLAVLLVCASAVVTLADETDATLVRDIAYAGAGGHARQKLDLYLPGDRSKPLPLIVWIHGGGWAAGDKSDCPAKRMVTRGYAVASVGYRLSGDVVFPAQIEDCKAAVRWLRAHAGEFGLDPGRFGAWGNSAGGHLAALLGTSAEVKEFEVGVNLEQSSRVQAVCDYYGPTDLLQMDAHALPNSRLKHDPANSPESRLVGGPIQQNKEKATRVNPITYVSADDPPFLIVHGDQDVMVPPHQNQLLYEALQKAGLTVRLHTMEGAGHGPGIGGREVDDMVNAFFDYHLKGAKVEAGAGRAYATRGVARVPAPVRGREGDPFGGGGDRPRRQLSFTWEQISGREDANRDGIVERTEFKGPAPMFDDLDRNGDGKLTKDDFASTAAPKA